MKAYFSESKRLPAVSGRRLFEVFCGSGILSAGGDEVVNGHAHRFEDDISGGGETEAVRSQNFAAESDVFPPHR